MCRICSGRPRLYLPSTKKTCACYHQTNLAQSSSRTTFLPPSRTKKTRGATYYETNESCREAGTTPGDADVLVAIQIDYGVFDVTALDLHLKVLDELDQGRVPLFVEEVGV